MKLHWIWILTLVQFHCTPEIESSERLPNIVIIFADDLGYGDLGRYGATGFSTPNLDKMAIQGGMFTHHYSAQAVCSASRAGLLTGCYPNRLGISGAYNHTAKVGLNREETTIAEMLKTKGYKTGIFGKWHLGHLPEFLPLNQGFDEFIGLPYSNDMWPMDYDGNPVDTTHRKNSYPPLPLIEGEKPIRYIETLDDQAELTTIYTEKAVDFIRRADGEPFFLYLPHSMPHVPLGVSNKFKGKSEQGMYGDVVMEIDWSVGEILSTLEETGQLENTLVVFTSDNGPWLNFGNHAGSTGGLREGKGTSFEGGQRVTCVVQWPERIQKGSVFNQLSSTIDWLPTIAAITGSELPDKKIDGVDISQVLFNDSTTNPRREFWYYYRKNHLEAVRKDNWKLVLPHFHRTYEQDVPGNDGHPGRVRQIKAELGLYDLRRDPGERYDVKDLYPEMVRELEEVADRARQDLGDYTVDMEGSGRREIGRVGNSTPRRTLQGEQKALNKVVDYNSGYSAQYSAGKEAALTDGKLGNMDEHNLYWQGFNGVDVDIVIDLEEVIEISTIEASFLKNYGSWIFPPEQVLIEISTDGKNFFNYSSKSINLNPDENTTEIIISGDSIKVKARYVRLFAKNVGQIPEWHPGKGAPAWLFIDEVVVR